MLHTNTTTGSADLGAIVDGLDLDNELFEDNSGAIDAIVEWMTTVNSPEWKANLEQLVEFDDEEVEDDERDE